MNTAVAPLDISHLAVSHIALQLAEANAAHTPLRVIGGGTWLDAGRPVESAATVHTAALTGVVEYVPGDLVITVRAGTTLREIAAITREHGQWLALDPWGSDEGTIGATIATASSGPLALGAGRIRDLVLGLSLLTADGTAVRGGGRVVKNVAGFDLVRLATGSFGTLGVITEASLRLHALPAVDETYAVSLGADGLSDIGHVLGLSALGYMALEVVNSAAAAACGDALVSGGGAQAGEYTLLARIAGNRARCDAQRDALQALGPTRAIGTSVWRALRVSEGAGSAVGRVSGAPDALRCTMELVSTCLSAAGVSDAMVCVSPTRGALRVMLPGGLGANALRMPEIVQALSRASHAQGGDQGFSVVWERLPAGAWQHVPAVGTDLISTRIRDAFDPARLLNPGIFGVTLATQQNAHMMQTR